MSYNLKEEFLATKLNELLGDYFSEYARMYKKDRTKVDALNEKLEKKMQKVLDDYRVYKERNRK